MFLPFTKSDKKSGRSSKKPASSAVESSISSNSCSAIGKSPAISSTASSGPALVRNEAAGCSVVSFPRTARKKKKNVTKKLRDGSQGPIETASGDNTQDTVLPTRSPNDRTPGKDEVSASFQN
jgi:hypothetical protein